MGNKATVLIVDDDPAFLKSAGEALCGRYEVSLAKSGAEAADLAGKGQRPDIILLDVDMPGMDGYETLERLRRIKELEDVPVLFLTGVTAKESELRGLEAGAIDYIQKPFVREILLARISRHLENGRRLRQLSLLEKGGGEGGVDLEKLRLSAAGLSETERKVLQLIAQGCTNREISEILHYSYDYVKRVASVIYEKKCVATRSELKKLLR